MEASDAGNETSEDYLSAGQTDAFLRSLFSFYADDDPDNLKEGGGWGEDEDSGRMTRLQLEAMFQEYCLMDEDKVTLVCSKAPWPHSQNCARHADVVMDPQNQQKLSTKPHRQDQGRMRSFLRGCIL